MSNRSLYQQYLFSKGLTSTQIGGILLNIEDESGFNPNPSGSNDKGMSYGLFQHYGSRKNALFRHAGTSSPTWQQQIDYALSEPEMQRYLSQDYANYGEAGVSFLQGFEKPAAHHAKARAAKYLSRHSGDVAPAGYAVPATDVGQGPAYQGQSIMPVSGVQDMPPSSSPAAQGTRPPELSANVPGDQGNSMLSRMAMNPWLQMGLGILSSPGNMGQGLQQGLLAANTNREGQRRQQLYEQQLALANRKQLGLTRMSPAEQMRQQIEQRRVEHSENVLQQQIHEYENPRMSQNLPADVERFAAIKGRMPESEAEFFEFMRQHTAASTKAGGSGGSGGNITIESALADLDSLELKAFGSGKPGEAGYVAGAFTGNDAGVLDRLWAGGKNLYNELTQPADPSGRMAEEYQREMRSVLGTFSRAFEEKGVLSDQDIRRVLLRMPQAGMYPDTEAYARDVFTELRKALLAKQAFLAKQAGSAMPPSGSAMPPSGSAMDGEPDWDSMTLEEIRAYGR